MSLITHMYSLSFLITQRCIENRREAKWLWVKQWGSMLSRSLDERRCVLRPFRWLQTRPVARGNLLTNQEKEKKSHFFWNLKINYFSLRESMFSHISKVPEEQMWDRDSVRPYLNIRTVVFSVATSFEGYRHNTKMSFWPTLKIVLLQVPPGSVDSNSVRLWNHQARHILWCLA